MRLDERLQAYADKLLLKRRREIDADLKKDLEVVVKRSTSPGTVLPGLLIKGLAEAYVDRIRLLGQARMNSLVTAFEDAGVSVDKDILQEIKSQAIALCHSEQHQIFNAIPNVLQSGDLRGQATDIVDEVTTKRIVQDVDSIMADLSLELDIKSDKLGLAEENKKRIYGAATGKRWDAFISHASEDKDLVRPLAAALEKSGLEVWFDETTLTVGDRLRISIDHGLSKSRFGICCAQQELLCKTLAERRARGPFEQRDQRCEGHPPYLA
jgi:hypothetical protein